MLYTLYRISDGGNTKDKLEHANKLYCLNNYLGVFGKDNLIVFADNCSDETLASIRALNLKIVVLPDIGNALSFIAILDYTVTHLKNDDFVYFLEDDYLHLDDAKKILLEGLQIADYVTLYDHPDKYVDFRKGGCPSIVENGEDSRVFVSKSSHWRTTNSTTMTFATKVKILKDDYAIWQLFKTNDYCAFQRIAKNPFRISKDKKILRNKLECVPPKKTLHRLNIIFEHFRHKLCNKNRDLIVSIPGRSTHIQNRQLSPLTDWNHV